MTGALLDDDEWTVADSQTAAAAAAGSARSRPRALPLYDPGITERPSAPRPGYLAAGARRFESGEVGAAAARQIPVALDRANYGLVPRGLDYETEFFPRQTGVAPKALLFEPGRFLLECGPQLGSALLTTIQHPELVTGPTSSEEAAIARRGAVITVDDANQPSAFGVPTRPLDVPHATIDDVRQMRDVERMRWPTWMDAATNTRDEPQLGNVMPGRVVGAVITNPQELALASAHTRVLRQLTSVLPPEGHLSKLQFWDSVRRPVLTTNDWDWFFDSTITDLAFRERVHQLVCTDLRVTVRVPTIYDSSTMRERAQLRLVARLLRAKILSSYEARHETVMNPLFPGQANSIVRVVPLHYY